MRYFIIILIILGFGLSSYVGSVYGLWIPRSAQELLEQSQTIFVGDITGVKAVNVTRSTTYGMEENGVPKTIVENYILTLEDYDVQIEKFLKNPQGFDTIKVRQPTISGAPSHLSVIGGFAVGDRVLFYLDKIDDENTYSPESFMVPKSCIGKDVLTQKRLEFGGDFAMIQDGIRVGYDNLTANKPILFIYDKNMDTLSGKSFDVAVEISKNEGKHAKAVFTKEIHSSSKPCEWIATAKWEFTPKEGSYNLDIHITNYDNSSEQSNTKFFVKSDMIHHYISPLKQFRFGIESDKIACKEGLGMKCQSNFGSSLNALVEPIYKSEIVLVGKIVEAKPILKQNQTEYGIKVDKYIKTPKSFDLITAIGDGIHKKELYTDEVTYYNTPIFKKDDAVFVYLNSKNGTYKISPYSFAISRNIPTGPPAENMWLTVDKSEYRYGDAITISGVIKKAYIFESSLRNQDSLVYLIVRNPDNQIYENKTLDVYLDGTFSHSFKIKGKLGGDGQYSYDVRMGDTTWSPVFSYYSGHIKSPLKQFTSGTRIDEIQCKKGFVIVLKASNGNPNCVKHETLEKLRERGWASPLGKIIFEKPSKSIQDLTEKSDRIITGMVTDKEKVGNHTEVWIGVYEWLKRPPYDAGTIILDLDNTGPFESKANFNKSEEVLLFLKDIEPNNGRFGLEYLQDNTEFKYPISMKDNVISFVKPEHRVREYTTDENCKNLTWDDDSFLYCTYPDKESRFYVPIETTLDHVKEKLLKYISEQYFKDHFDLKRAYDEAVINGHSTPVGQSMEFDYHIGNMTFNYTVRASLENSEVYLYYVPPREIQSIPFENKANELIYSCLEPGTYKVFWTNGIGQHTTHGFSTFSEGYGPPEIRNRYGDLMRAGDMHFRIWYETGDVECADMNKDYSNSKLAMPGQDKILLIDSTEFLKIKNRK